MSGMSDTDRLALSVGKILFAVVAIVITMTIVVGIDIGLLSAFGLLEARMDVLGATLLIIGVGFILFIVGLSVPDTDSVEDFKAEIRNTIADLRSQNTSDAVIVEELTKLVMVADSD